MSDAEKKLLHDILASIEAIDRFLDHQRNFNSFIDDEKTRSAVERQLSIIGEAVSQLIAINAQIQITYARQIKAFRNRVVHSYDSLNNALVWKVIVRDIPVLETEVRQLLNS